MSGSQYAIEWMAAICRGYGISVGAVFGLDADVDQVISGWVATGELQQKAIDRMEYVKQRIYWFEQSIEAYKKYYPNDWQNEPHVIEYQKQIILLGNYLSALSSILAHMQAMPTVPTEPVIKPPAKPPEKPTCPEGQIYNEKLKMCIPTDLNDILTIDYGLLASAMVITYLILNTKMSDMTSILIKLGVLLA